MIVEFHDEVDNPILRLIDGGVPGDVKESEIRMHTRGAEDGKGAARASTSLNLAGLHQS